MRWSHLVADTAEELHSAAGALGLSRERAQERGSTLHYDLPDAWREDAIARGVAKSVSCRELIAMRDRLAPGRRARRRARVSTRR